MKIRSSNPVRCSGARRVVTGGLLCAAALSWLMAGAQAEPTNGVIAAGGGVGASINSGANVGGGFDVTIQQNSDRMVINWDDFNIDPNDVVNFNQPSSAAIAVNRVVGGALTPTAIDGSLTSVGHVWILDPAGVAFGAGAVVDVGGLLATTSALDTAAFMATDPATGTYTFTEDGTGAVTNAAGLDAQGLIALVAPMVTNSGALTSDNGDVLLGGAKAFRLSFMEADRTPAGGGAVYQELLVTDFIIDTGVDNAVAPAETVPVTQTAAGSARGSNIIVSAASVGGGAFLNVDGVVEATNVGTGSGSVMLLGGANLVGGAVAATGTETVRTTDLGVDAAGALTVQSGAVSIAASAQDISVGSASIESVTGDATLNDAIVATGAIGISANAGNVDIAALTAGTTITVSGQDIDLAGKVDATTTAMLTATAGDVSSAGALEIEGSAVTVSGPILAATDATVTATSVDATLDAVTATNGAIAITATTGNIDVGATTAGTTITLSGQDIDLAGKVDATTTVMLTATAGDVSSAGALEIEGSAVTVSGPILAATDATVTATSGDATLDAVTATAGAIAINAATGNIDVGATTAGTSITVSGQDLDLAGKVDATTTAMLTATAGDVSSAGALEIEGSAVTVSGPVLAATDATVTATSGDATLDAVTATTGAIAINAATGNIDVGATTAGTTITLSGQDIDLAGKVDATTTAMLTATAGNVSSTGALEIEGSAVTVSGPVLAATDATVTATSGDATLDAVTATTGAIAINAATGNIDVGATTAGTTITLSGQDIDLAGKVDATTTATLTATAGNVSSTSALDVEGSAVSVSGDIVGTEGVTLTSTSGNVTVGTVSAPGGNVTVDATGGSVSMQAVTASVGAIGITANSGNVDVGATTAGTSITVSGQDIDLAGKVTAGTGAALTATVGDISSTGSMEIEAGSVSLFGRVTAAADVLLTALTGGITSTGSITTVLGDIIGNAANGPISVNDLEAVGDIRLVGGSVNVSGTATAHGSAFLQAITGDVTVGGSVAASGGTLVLNASNGSALLNRIGALNDVSLTVTDLDLSGSISAGDQFILETDRTGQTLIFGGDGTAGGVTLRRPASLVIDEAELARISAGRFDIDGGANDVLLLDARLTSSSLDTMMIGTDQSARIIAAGTVTGLSSLQLGYQTGRLDRRPDLILISGQLGLDTGTGRLGTVRLESANDIVIGTEKFLEFFESDTLSLLGLASLPLSVSGGIDDHVFIATDQLQMLASGSIVQLNTGRGVEGAGLVFNVPSSGDGVLFPSENGPEEVLIFGEVIRADGTRVTAFNASLEENILFAGSATSADPALTQNDQYYMNFCLIGDPVSCSADSLREIERNNRFINGDPSGLGGVIPVVFETGENDEREEEEDLGGVAASGNEALWDAGGR